MADRPVGREFLSIALGAVIGTGVSYVAADRQRAADQRDARRTAATQVFQEVGRLMDARFYRIMRLEQSLGRRSADTNYWQRGYDSLTQLWHERLPTNVAVVCHYLGNKRATELRDISLGLSGLRIAFKGSQPLSDSIAEAVRSRIFVFELHVADQLRKGDVFEGEVEDEVAAEDCARLERQIDRPQAATSARYPLIR
jgi:hypothetical protein